MGAEGRRRLHCGRCRAARSEHTTIPRLYAYYISLIASEHSTQLVVSGYGMRNARFVLHELARLVAESRYPKPGNEVHTNIWTSTREIALHAARPSHISCTRVLRLGCSLRVTVIASIDACPSTLIKQCAVVQGYCNPVPTPDFGVDVVACRRWSTLSTLRGGHGPSYIFGGNTIAGITWYMFWKP
jgi:hypothetical protein